MLPNEILSALEGQPVKPFSLIRIKQRETALLVPLDSSSTPPRPHQSVVLVIFSEGQSCLLNNPVQLHQFKCTGDQNWSDFAQLH